MDNELVAVAQRIISGNEVPDVDFAKFRPLDNPKAEKAGNLLWYSCRQFQDDADIRAREPNYDKGLRETVGWHLKHYLALCEVS